jgi:uncharacterized protein YoaH (UPF0181 family)
VNDETLTAQMPAMSDTPIPEAVPESPAWEAAPSGEAVAIVAGEFSEVRQDGEVYWLQTVLLKRPQQLPFGAPLYTAPQQPAAADEESSKGVDVSDLCRKARARFSPSAHPHSVADWIEQQALAQQPAAVNGLAARLVDELDGLVSESDGVSGLHLNGDVATWEELLPGGRFECLSSLDELREALASAQQQQQTRNPWQEAVDRERVSAHLGIAADGVSVDEAVKQVAELIDWHVQVATDPFANGGFSLQPVQQQGQAVAVELTRDAERVRLEPLVGWRRQNTEDEMDMTHCPHCHERLTPPRKPDGCVCDAGEWRDPDRIPPACGAYDGDGLRHCRTCEHGKECHLPATNAEVKPTREAGSA